MRERRCSDRAVTPNLDIGRTITEWSGAERLHEAGGRRPWTSSFTGIVMRVASSNLSGSANTLGTPARR